jgi:uncharacterized protein (DUF58 family)
MKRNAITDNADGTIYIGQSSLIGLQSEATLLKLTPTLIRSNMTGQYLSRFKGRGMEFDESRPYQPGDDIRNMDWRVTARTSKAHSKVFREERERPVLLWVDFSPSMFFATRVCFKSVLAAKLAALLSWKAIQQGDRLGALLFSQSKHLELRPKRGKTAVLRLIKHLSEFSRKPPGKDDNSSATLQHEDHALNRLVQVTRPGSLIYLISDFRQLSQQLESTLSRLSAHNEVVLLHIHDPLESSLPQAGYYQVTDGRKEAAVNASDNKVKQQYHQRFIDQQQQLVKLCQKYRAAYRTASTNQSPLEILRRTMRPTRGAA